MKKRLDLLLVEKGLFGSRNKAQVHILAGEVYVNKEKVLISSKVVDIESHIEIKLLSENYVSRGGLKLAKAVSYYNLNIKNKICLDAGASTGGFTDCLLREGAKRVYSIDVGYGQLDFKLRNNNKIINLENTNVRYLSRENILDDIDLIVMDVSFISITKFSNFFKEFTKENNEFVALIKPQFELSKEKVGKKGVVQEAQSRQLATKNVKEFLQAYYEHISEVIESPIKGAKGNIEYLVYCNNI